MSIAITTHLEGKLAPKAYLFSIKYLNLDTNQEISLGSLIVNSQSAQTSIRLIDTKDMDLQKNFNFDEIAKECLDFVRKLEENRIFS